MRDRKGGGRGDDLGAGKIRTDGIDRQDRFAVAGGQCMRAAKDDADRDKREQGQPVPSLCEAIDAAGKRGANRRLELDEELKH